MTMINNSIIKLMMFTESGTISRSHITINFIVKATALPCYLVSLAVVQQRATIWFHCNRFWAVLGTWYQFVLPLRKSSFIVARQVLFGLPLCLFPPYGIEPQVGGECDQLTECVFLPPCRLDFWTLHDLLLHHFLFFLSRISLNCYEDGSDGTHLEYL